MISVLIIFSALQSFGQDYDDFDKDSCYVTESKKAIKKYKKAVTLLRKYETKEAISLLKEALEIDTEYVDAHWRLGKIYFNQRRMKDARKYFEAVISICPYYDIYAYYYLGRISYGREEWSTAIDHLKIFLEDVDKIKSDRDYNHATDMLEQAEFFKGIYSSTVPFEPRVVNKISTSADEYLSIITADNELSFFTRKVKKEGRRGAIDYGIEYEEYFMMAKRGADGKFGTGKQLPEPFNTFDNEGGATLTIQNDELFYTVCQFVRIGKWDYYNCDIYTSRFEYGYWTDIEKLDTNGINRDDSWESQPTITSDGNTLYFASDRDGGYGGTDIYMITRDENGVWGKPVNLGKRVNTAGNEKSPFIHTDSQTLYFSSSDRVGENDSIYKGHRGLGGFDIFYIRLDKGWKEPKNIGYPINSEHDDISFFVSTDGKTGYFASNKLDGVGGWDLYEFDLYEEARPQEVLFIKGTINEEERPEWSDEPIPAKVELKNIETNEVLDIEVDSITGSYVAATLFKNDFVITVKQEDYTYQSRYIDKDSSEFHKPVEINFEMEKVKVGSSYRLHDIYFAYNSDELSEKSLFILDEFIIFLNENPNVKIDIHGHTDNIGNDAFNLDLSERRARSVYNYLVEQGIDPSRLSSKGYGESKPVASNNTSEGRAKNRRTEFVITDK